MCMALVLAQKLNALCITFCILELGFEISVKPRTFKWKVVSLPQLQFVWLELLLLVSLGFFGLPFFSWSLVTTSSLETQE